MKKIYLLSKACLFTAAMFMFSACAEDDATMSPVFPENEIPLNVKVGDKTEVTFTANMDWELTSSALWCVFSDGSRRISGLAGEQKVELSISDEMLTFEESVSDITLTMGGESEVIAKVYRAPQEYELSILLSSDESVCSEENPVHIQFSNFADEVKVKIQTNFDWKFENTPDCLIIDEQEMQGKANETKEVSILLNPDYRLEAQNLQLLLQDKSGNQRGIVYVKYDGMSEEDIDFSISDPMTPYIFSFDALTYTTGGTNSTTYDAPLKFNIYSHAQEFAAVYLTYNEWDGYAIATATGYEVTKWVKDVEFNKNEVSISVPENETATKREQVIMIMPKNVYDLISGDLKTNLIERVGYMGEIKSEYKKYLAITVQQEIDAEKFEVKLYTDDSTYKVIETIPYSEGGYSDEEIYGVFYTYNVRMLVLPKGESYSKIEIKVTTFPETEGDIKVINMADWSMSFGTSNIITLTNIDNNFGSDEILYQMNDSQNVPFCGLIVRREK